MWSPADNSALPTPEERKKAKEAIDSVQRDLESAMELLAQAQLRVDLLMKDLEERNAWIAPVRRLTFDVLSMIFEWCADIKWDSPIRIAAVCRSWRTIVLDTPRAWSFVDLSSHMPNEGISVFFERSRERPLHVKLCRSSRLALDLTSVAHRIHSLFLLEFPISSRTLEFPKVQRLSIGGSTGVPLAELLAELNTRFPTLLHLVTVRAKIFHRHGSVNSNLPFPHLKSWSLRTSDSIAWVDGLRIGSSTLVSLTIQGHSYGKMDRKPQILFPVLNCLKLLTSHVSKGRFNFKTPRLETYGEETDLLEGPIHTDVSTVTQMRFTVQGSPSLSLSFCLGLKTLQIRDRNNNVINSVLDQLSASGEICPVLQVIELLGEYTNADIAPYLEKLSGINDGRAHAINMAVLTKWTELPGSSLDSVW